MQIPDIKKNLPITTVLAHYNIKLDPSTSSGRANHIKCPFHDDDKPSCKIYLDTNTFHCFGCGATGDQIEVCVKMEGDKHKGILKATELASQPTETNVKAGGETKNKSAMGIASRRETATEVNFETLFLKFKESLPRSPKALEYLKQRRLLSVAEASGVEVRPLSGVEVGYNSGTYYKKLKYCIIFPLKDKTGNTVSLYGRRIYNSTPGFNESHTLEFGKHYYSENRKGLYPNYPNENTETLIITEAIIDAASLLQCTDAQPCVSILAAYGTNGLTTEHIEAIKEWASSGVEKQEIIFFFDGDQAGHEGIIKCAEKLQHLKCKISSVPTPDGEDINSLFVTYGKEAILKLIEERQLIGETEERKTETEFSHNKQSVLPSPVSISPLDINQPNKIIFETLTARYITKGSLPKTFDKMVISLDVQHLETALKYRCRLDLYEEKQTRKEAREAAEKLELRSDLVENDLSTLCDLLEEFREKQLDNLKMSQFENGETTVPLTEQAKCKAFLQQGASTGSATLMQRLNDLIGKSGIVGEQNNRLFLFVIATSHKMPDTLHALIQGSSGSGKTHLLSKIAELMPSERVVKFTRVTENSFYNYDEYFFRGKLICLEDIDGLKEEALFAWRELISNNQLSSSTSQKDENGNIHGAQRIVRGPMASICATTHGQIYEDNMSRMFIVAVDESHEQTQRIMNYQSLAASGIADKEQENEAKEFLQNCIRMLKPQKVINPYADKIKLPPQAHKIRRLHELFLSFVKQVTLINQYQRQHDKQGRLITEPIDLRVAVEIMFDSIFLKVDELDGSLRQFYEQLKEYILQKENPQNYEFTQREIRHALHLSKTQLHRYLNELNELEYLQQSGGYANKGFKYKISYWDNIQKLRNEIQDYLFGQINKLAFQGGGTQDGTLEAV